jgi:hypothetical protein
MSGLPSLPRGRPTQTALAVYQDDVQAFCARILEINSSLDFRVSSRGWCYLLEGSHIITKGEFDAAQRLINDCRKNGDLPIDICAVDDKRAADGIEDIDSNEIEDQASSIVESVQYQHLYYTPFSFWDDLDVYIELAVEKIDLKGLFAGVASNFHVPIANIGGWSDINGRAAMMHRFAHWEREGKQCILLYCGDHDPGGLQISDFLRSNMAELKGAVGWDPRHLMIDRFGLNADFIEANGLTWIENLETSKGKRLDHPSHPDHFKLYVQAYLKQFGARKCEANALVVRPEAGRELCRRTIEKYLPKGAIADHRTRLNAIRQELRSAILHRLAEGQAP